MLWNAGIAIYFGTYLSAIGKDVGQEPGLTTAFEFDGKSQNAFKQVRPPPPDFPVVCWMRDTAIIASFSTAGATRQNALDVLVHLRHSHHRNLGVFREMRASTSFAHSSRRKVC
jgi:hypothetical protein